MDVKIDKNKLQINQKNVTKKNQSTPGEIHKSRYDRIVDIVENNNSENVKVEKQIKKKYNFEIA